ncbi:unnamed protein product [Ectocarpus sp. 13 AM-2016]
MFTGQLSSSAGLDSLIRENPEALEDIQRVLESTVAGSFYPDDERRDMERRRKLGTFVTMSNALGEVALRRTEDMDIQRKELALPPFSREYYTAIRTGLCEAYLAASVIDSDWMPTSKTGGMGKAGAALKLMSSAVPVIGGLTGQAGKALETEDHYVQTRRLVKVGSTTIRRPQKRRRRHGQRYRPSSCAHHGGHERAEGDSARSTFGSSSKQFNEVALTVQIAPNKR